MEKKFLATRKSRKWMVAIAAMLILGGIAALAFSEPIATDGSTPPPTNWLVASSQLFVLIIGGSMGLVAIACIVVAALFAAMSVVIAVLAFLFIKSDRYRYTLRGMFPVYDRFIERVGQIMFDALVWPSDKIHSWINAGS